MADEEYHPLLPGAQKESLASAARVEEILMQKPVAASRYIQLFGWESKLLWILSGASIVVSICNYMPSFVTLCFSGHLGALELAGASIAMVGTQGFAYGIMPTLFERFCRLVSFSLIDISIDWGLEYTIDRFLFIFKRQEDGFWLVEEKNNSHNHEPSSDMSGHPSCRRLSQEEITTIEEMTRSGIPPRQILSSLRQSNPKLQAISRTIYNTKVKLRKGNLAGRTMIQVLFEELCQEGAHAKLKQHLQVSTGDLHQVKNKICLVIDNEFNEIKTQLSSERIRVPHKCDNYFFKELITNVSSFALRELLKKYEMVKYGTMRSTCTGHFMASMGLPCAHKMIGWKGKVIPLEEIHTQWRIDGRVLVVPEVGETNGGEFKRLVHELEDKNQEWPLSQKECVQGKISQLINPPIPLVLEPNILPYKGRPSGSKKGTTSTRRNASKFEIVDATRKCSICRGVGHNSQTCKGKSEANTMNSNHILTLDDGRSTVDVLGRNSLPTSLDYFLLD
ncbi:hypothetical protein Vadar_014710 [Vaccinium darrowii]|uniref:Uncharacterized protein n=1 Tax=Vaccinium darrowii TaxID=229202 RepID=A0ACB7ZBJ5_9ERIC|nr:hypothetical protein Vadar_014710 [Vaccinium darrowii]